MRETSARHSTDRPILLSTKIGLTAQQFFTFLNPASGPGYRVFLVGSLSVISFDLYISVNGSEAAEM